jgi:hypothetical protein
MKALFVFVKYWHFLFILYFDIRSFKQTLLKCPDKQKKPTIVGFSAF